MARTKREFEVDRPDFWQTVDAWAKAHADYLQSEEEDDLEAAYERTYRTRAGVTMMPVYLRVIQVGTRVRVEGWMGPGENPLEAHSLFGGQRSASQFGMELFKSLVGVVDR